MRLVITQNVTADGAVEMLTDWFDPSDHDQDWLPSCGARTRAVTPCCWDNRPTTPPASATSSTG